MKYGDLLGIRFTPHGRSKQDGFDCYGLAIEVLARNGIKLRDLYYESLKVSQEFVDELKLQTEKLEKPEENCIVEMESYGQLGHMGVYIGEGLMIHTFIDTNVVIEPLSHYKNRIRGFYRVKN